jgi:hypothetical protein
MDRSYLMYLTLFQAFTLLLASTLWFRVWQCPCGATIQDAAFWTGLIISQAVFLLAWLILRLR